VVADGNLDDIRSRAGSVRYFAGFSSAGNGTAAPGKQAVRDALAALSGAQRVTESPTEEGLHRFEVAGTKSGDLRPEIFRLAVAKGWTLLELRRDAQSLDSVFRDLTRGDEKLDRGAGWSDGTVDASGSPS
jgi:ABC-2 type transport system ATP-binding protein